MHSRTERDSMGELQVPGNALYQAQTQRAVQNFQLSHLTLPPAFIRALLQIKKAAASANQQLGLLDANIATAISQAADLQLADFDMQQYPVDVFQTGSATSSNMNVNEVLATLASRQLGQTVNPNDHVNLGQSSNDTIPSAIHVSAANFFSAIGSQDSAVATSGALKTLAVSLLKISNDLRWMNSGPLAGLAEIALPALQPGSSIMPGKVNPVIPEAVAMLCAQVVGNDATITLAGQSGNFELNVMLPVIAYNLLQSIELLANGCTALADQAISGFTVLEDNISQALALNPILVTALNPLIGYAKAAEIAKQAYKQQRPVLDVALEHTTYSRTELEQLLDPARLTHGGNVSSG